MSQTIKRVAVTGGAGQINYSLLFHIANGGIFGPDQPIALHVLEVTQAINALQGVVLELEDCCFPLLKEVVIGSDPMKVFENVNYAILVGAKPRGPGMERKDLLADNGKIFIGQGKALNQVAAKDVRILVVGNPCNTNCLILMHNAPDIPRDQFFSMTRLDENRAKTQLAQKAGVDVTDVSNVTIWGNHSSTQVPDFLNAKIQGQKASDVIKDRQWLEGPFIERIQKRGAEIITARGKSSAASAAHAIVGAARSLITPTPSGDWFSMGVLSDNNPYDIKKDLFFSFPCTSNGDGKAHIVDGVLWDDFLEQKVSITEKELLEERDLVKDLL